MPARLSSHGVLILANSGNDDALWRKSLNSVSIEYGWVRNGTPLIVTAAGAIALALVGLLNVRWI